jgi:hypothetical protein
MVLTRNGDLWVGFSSINDIGSHSFDASHDQLTRIQGTGHSANLLYETYKVLFAWKKRASFGLQILMKRGDSRCGCTVYF